MMNILPLFAFLAGSGLALQATMNARLGVLLNNSMLATAIAFLSSFVVSIVIIGLFSNQMPTTKTVGEVPLYLWFSGVVSALGVGAFYLLIPKMGAGSMMSFALTGQLMISIIASHFGWFEQPVKQIDFQVTIGFVAMVIGIVLINGEFNVSNVSG